MLLSMLKKPHQAWLSLSPDKQFLFWVVSYPLWPILMWLTTFAMIALQQSGAAIGMNHFLWVWGIGCAGFVLHLFAHLYLAVVWPHFYQRPADAPASSFTGWVLGLFR